MSRFESWWELLGPWSSGMTPPLHGGDGGSSPPGSTGGCGVVAARLAVAQQASVRSRPLT